MNFDKAFQLIVAAEGGYVNDPNDPGGRTIYGITERDHPDLWAKGPPTVAQAKERYRAQYWDPIRGDDLPWPLSLYVFDSAVNQGVTTAIKILQQSVRTATDGVLGPATLRAVSVSHRDELEALFMAHRALKYTTTRGFDRYGKGWLKRQFQIVKEGSK